MCQKTDMTTKRDLGGARPSKSCWRQKIGLCSANTYGIISTNLYVGIDPNAYLSG